MANTKATDLLKIAISSIESSPLSYKHTNEIFNFDDTPRSILDKAYRFHMNTEGVVALSSKNVNKEKRVDFWFAYKIKRAKDDIKNELLEKYDLQEEIEDALLSALINIESMVLDSATVERSENHFIINIGFNFVFKRSLT